LTDKLSSNGQGVGGFPQHPNTKVEAHQTNGRYQAQSEAARQSRDVKTDEETNLQTLAVSENARQLLKVLQPFEARITELEAEIHTLQMDSREKEATLQDLERKILRLQQDSQDRVTALEDEIADLQEQGQKDTDYLNEGIELARVSLDNKNAMPRQLEAELQSVKLDSQEKDDIIMALSLESKEKDETISALKSEVSRLETARVKAEDELQWWKLENCNGRDQQNHIQDTPHSHQDVDAGISHIHQSGRKESTN
jgi:chromosome segregation ATPase